jgi:hypothetical protein
VAARWRPDEDERLRRMYRAGLPLRAISQEIGRSEEAVTARRRTLHLPARRSLRPWSELEDTLLRLASVRGVPATELAPRLRRPVESVRARRRQLRLARPAAQRYTAADDATLRARWWSGGDVEALARELGRTPDALRLHAHRLGLHRPPPRRRWTPAEDAIVRDGYTSGLSCGEIADSLPDRSPTAVAARARKLGLATYARRWTTQDDARLCALLQVRTLDDTARLLGRTPEAIRRRAAKLALPPATERETPRAGMPWTAGEDEVLRLHAALNPSVLAALVGRSDRAIVTRLRRLGLRAGRWRSPHHPTPTRGRLTPGEQALVERELQARGNRAVPSLERRLEQPLLHGRRRPDRPNLQSRRHGAADGQDGC